jgi:ribosomal protein S18 acetylase RimI-like enzyme
MKSNHIEIKLRDARCDELGIIAKLFVAAYQEYKDFMPADRWDWYRNDMMDVRSRMPNSELIVAEVRNKIAGAVTLFPQGSNNGWPAGWAGIRLLAVHPDYRGRGIGRGLMDECIRRCRERGTKTIGLHTTELMKVARAMYERIGFERIPEFDFHPAPDTTVFAYRLDL